MGNNMFGDVVKFDRSQRNDDGGEDEDGDEEAFLLAPSDDFDLGNVLMDDDPHHLLMQQHQQAGGDSSAMNPQDDHAALSSSGSDEDGEPDEVASLTAAAAAAAQQASPASAPIPAAGTVVSPSTGNNNNTSSAAAAAAAAGVINPSTHSLRSRRDSYSMVVSTNSPLAARAPPKRGVRKRPCSYYDDDDDDGGGDDANYDHNSNNGADFDGRDTPQHKRASSNRARFSIFGIPCCSLNRMAAFVLWSTIVSLAVAVVWYSYELFNHGTDPHKIAWFSAGAFVLLGFPVSMWGILGHLMNYNAPGTQVYVVRILWMVPIYSIQSWLAMRFHKQAVFIETLRDFYESYVLYSFTQFLTEVLGGEEALILMLKDKSPTRGVHMWGLQWCVKPWIMGQPVRRYSSDENRSSFQERLTAAMTSSPVVNGHKRGSGIGNGGDRRRRGSRVHWKSPFYIKCKFGVLQYVLIKLVCAVAVLLLEYMGWYKEGEFKWSAGYLYICIVTNVSQCWALYCLIFFYYATKTELSPIRPVGKFLSVKALVFFTWWQSVFISILVQMDLIPTYRADERDWTSDDVAKGIQDYLICMEMFVAAVVHTFVFPHSEYSVAAVNARANAIHPKPAVHTKRLGRKRLNSSSDALRQLQIEQQQQQQQQQEVEMVSLDSAGTWDDRIDDDGEHSILLDGPDDRPGLFKAFMDSAIPRDLTNNTFGMMKGDFNVEKKTLLHHAATSDQYDLFSSRRFSRKNKQRLLGESVSETDSGAVDDVV